MTHILTRGELWDRFKIEDFGRKKNNIIVVLTFLLNDKWQIFNRSVTGKVSGSKVELLSDPNRLHDLLSAGFLTE